MIKITPYDWQQPLVEAAVSALQRHKVFISAFPTGSGKTVIALEVARRIGGPWLVIAPKISITAWKRTAKRMGVDTLIDVINPEQISKPTGCKYYSRPIIGQRIDRKTGKKKDVRADIGTWSIPAGCSVVWDEPHRSASGIKSAATFALGALRSYARCIHPMSATLADSPLKLRAVGWLCGLHQFNEPSFYAWCRAHGCAMKEVSEYNSQQSFMFTQHEPTALKHMAAIRKAMGDKLMSLSASEIPDFPTQTLQTLFLDLSNKDQKEAVKLLAKIEDASDRLQSVARSKLAEVNRARERLEFILAPLLAHQAVKEIEDGSSTVNFFSYTEPRELFEETLTTLLQRSEKKLPTGICSIHGGQTPEVRQSLIDQFQANAIYAASVQLKAGGAAVSLHDELHQRPRVSYILPAYEADDVKQALGRIRRCQGTHATQNFVIMAGTIQERVASRLETKLSCIDTLNDADLSLKGN